MSARRRCVHGRPVPCAGRHFKTFADMLGPLILQCACYHCEWCKSGFCPRNHALDLENNSLSPAVMRKAGMVVTTVSFAEGP